MPAAPSALAAASLPTTLATTLTTSLPSTSQLDIPQPPH